MNENHVDTLLSQHGDEILTRRTPTPSKRKVAWKPILVTGTAVVAIGTFLLLPKNAEAAKIVKIKNAMKHIHSMETNFFASTNGGPMKPFHRIINQDGKTRFEGLHGRGLTLTSITNGPQNIKSYDKLPFALLSHHENSVDPLSELGMTDPLKAALAGLNGSPDPKDYKYSTSSGSLVNGRRTYVINYSRSDTKSTLRIIVDESTDLPIESFQREDPEGNAQHLLQNLHTTYEYNKRYDQSLFEIKSYKQIIDVQAEQEKLSQKWSESMVISGGAPIYLTSVTPDGTIWVAYGVKDSEKLDSVPSEVNVPGFKYVLAQELPTSFTSDGRSFRIHGNQVMVASFVPIYDPVELPSKVDIRFGNRQILNGRPTWKVDKVFDLPVLRVEVQTESMSIPFCLPVFGYDREYLYLATKQWDRKAKAREELGDIAGAADAYVRSAHAWEKYVIYMAKNPYREAARCYEKLGELDKAKKLRALSDELDRSRIR